MNGYEQMVVTLLGKIAAELERANDYAERVNTNIANQIQGWERPKLS